MSTKCNHCAVEVATEILSHEVMWCQKCINGYNHLFPLYRVQSYPRRDFFGLYFTWTSQINILAVKSIPKLTDSFGFPNDVVDEVLSNGFFSEPILPKTEVISKHFCKKQYYGISCECERSK